MDLESFIQEEFEASSALLAQMSMKSRGEILSAGDLLSRCLAGGNKILIFGNGGSAADALHFAAELVGRYRDQRRPLPALALVDNTAVITSLANDFAFSEVFSRQVHALARPGDIAIGITTSGRSINVIAGLAAAREHNAHTLALTGSFTHDLAPICDVIVSAPSSDTPRIQEAHAVIIHALCGLVELTLGSSGEKDR